ncbi:MAG: DUF11 domain-containing protein [Methanobacterium paludis]|nr:DUF11 domain-containing protein [Methanobacterium paludis]
MRKKQFMLLLFSFVFIIAFCGTSAAATNDSTSISSPASADIQVNQTQTTFTGTNGSQYVTYIITVSNNGPDNATGVQITDTLPTGVQWNSDNSQGTYDPTTGIWNIGNLNNGDNTTLTITALITGTGTIKNTAAKTNETETDWNYDDNSQTTILTVSGTYTPNADIRVLTYPWYYNTATQSYEYNYMCGNTPVFVVDVRNSNAYDDATGVVVEYVLGEGFEYSGCDTQGVGTATYDSSTRTITWNIGYMPKNSRAFMKVLTRIIETGNQTPNLTNTASLEHVDQYDVNSANNQANCSISSPASADIQVNQTQTTFMGTDGSQYVTYTINVTNNGPDNATGVQITDTLPTGVQWNSDNSQGTYDPTTGIWNIGNLNNGV